jgi:ribosome biogenesis protein MAK21
MESMQAMKASMPKADGDDDDDSDDDDVDDDSLVEYPIHPDEHASSDTEGGQEEPSDAEDDGPVDWDGVGLSSSSDASDADESDVVNLDASAPLVETQLTVYEQAGSATQVSPALSGGKKRKQKGSGKEDERVRKKKLRALPTFASYEDYAQMIEDGPEEDI